MSLILNGVGVSRGIAIGKVHILNRGEFDLQEAHIPKESIGNEIKRFKAALQAADQHLQEIRKSIENKFPSDIVGFIDSHLLMLNDELLGDAVVDIIKQRQCNAEWALQIQQNQLTAVFDEMQNDYLKTRRDDVEHVIHLIHRFLTGHNGRRTLRVTHIRNHIIIADDLTPADTILLQHQNISGFATELGGPTSHTAILARGMNIPAVVAVNNIRTLTAENETIILDGKSGIIIADADTTLINEYYSRQRKEKQYAKQLLSLSDRKTITRDGRSITLMANIELADEIKILKKIKASGIGLYRTEFLYLDRESAAMEEEQYRTYRRLLKAMDSKPVTIRTLDLGAEKEFDPKYKAPLTLNPALGLRAIRRSLKDPESFLQQLRAILRASAHGEVRIMLPMLTNIHELDQIKQLIETAKSQLHNDKKAYDKNIRVGGMIEVPAAALSAEYLAKHLDFLSIGTNDLIQYTLAIDRIDEQVNYLYDPLHPSILKLIKLVIRAGENAGIPVAMCGEMAGDPNYIKLLLGMGLTEFSVHLSTLLEVKKIILESDTKKLKNKCRKIFSVDPKKIPDIVASL